MERHKNFTIQKMYRLLVKTVIAWTARNMGIEVIN